MGFGSKNGGKMLFFTFMNLKKEDDNAYIQVFDRSLGEKGEVIDECEYVEGELIDIKFGTGSYESDEYLTCALILKDHETGIRYKVGCNFDRMTILMRTILNRLLSAQSFDDIYIAYFGAKGDYKNVSIKSSGEKLEYLYTREETDQFVEVIKDKKGTVIKRDYSELDEHLKKQVEENILPRLRKDEQKSEPKERNSNVPAKEEDYDQYETLPDDDNPFSGEVDDNNLF